MSFWAGSSFCGISLLRTALFDAKLKIRLFEIYVEQPLIKSKSYSTFTAHLPRAFILNLQLRIKINDALQYFLLLFKLFYNCICYATKYVMYEYQITGGSRRRF